MNETEPIYITKLEERLKNHLNGQFLEIRNDIEDLARITANSFKKVDEKFNKIDERFDGIDGRLNGIDSRLDKEFSIIDSRLDRLESNVVEIKEDIGKIEKHIGRYEIRAQNIEQILLQDYGPRIIELEKNI